MILIVIHSLCMMIVGTRVATLGTIAVAVIAFIGYLIILLLKQGRLQVVSLAFMAFMIAFCSLVFPYSPAIKHQQENAVQIQSNREIVSAPPYQILRSCKVGVCICFVH